MSFTSNDFTEKAGEYTQKGKEIAGKSAKDWFHYIQDHPLQTLVFGAVIYFAMKGMAKD